MHSDQIKAKQHIEKWKVGALFMEAGTGKTRVALSIVNESPCDKVFWICPIRTIQNAKDEVAKWGGFHIQTSYYGIESIQASDRIYANLVEEVKACKKPFVVVDESLKIKNYESKRTKRMLAIGKMVEYKLILNGTVLSRNLMDLWSQMEFLSPLILNMTHQEYKNTFCEYKRVTKCFGYKSYTKEYITGYANIDYLYSLIRNYAFKCDLSLNVTQCYHTIHYSIDYDSMYEYERIKEDFLSDEMLEWRNNNIFLEMTQKMQHAYCVTEDKFNQVEALFKSINEEDTIIFCKYIISHEACVKRFPKALVLSYQKESLGLNLQQYHNTIYFDKVWDYALKIQSGRRTFRTGQEHDCEYWELTGNVGLERMIDRNIRKKTSMYEYFKSKTKEDLLKEL